jgi:hypothetical protein
MLTTVGFRASLSVQSHLLISVELRKYSDRPMDLADASLVWPANATGVTDIDYVRLSQLCPLSHVTAKGIQKRVLLKVFNALILATDEMLLKLPKVWFASSRYCE